MAAAIPVIADIFVSAVVSKVASKVVTEVASGLGMSDSAANLLGGIAGIAAGSYSYGMASDAMNAADAASQAGQLAEQTAEFSDAGNALTSEALSTSGTTASSVGANKSLMSGYVDSPAAKALGNVDAGSVKTVGSSPEALSTSQVANAAKETPWYESMWDSDMLQRTAGGFVQGATGAVLQGDAAEDAYDQKRKDELEDEERKRWKKPINADGLNSFNGGSGYQSKYVKRSNKPLMQRGASA